MAKRKARVICVIARKGGVGKTTTAISVAAILATTAETILVDLDSQGSAAMSLGCDMATGAAELVSREPVELSRVDGLKLDVAPGNARLVTLAMSRVEVLRELPHRHIVVDCASSEKIGAVLEALQPDVVLVVTTKENASKAMMPGALELAKQHCSRVAIVQNKLNKNAIAKEATILRKHFGLKVFSIRTDISTFERLTIRQLPITAAPKSKAHADMKRVTQWL